VSVVTTARILLLALVCPAAFCQFHTYVGQLSNDRVLLAWGTTQGPGNTIGRDSKSLGPAVVRVGDRTAEVKDHNWKEVDGLEPDTVYPYEVSVNGTRIGQGSFRTWAKKASRLVFFVVGDFGTGDSAQRRIADAMWEEFEKRSATPDPVRFVLTVGDNIYGSGPFGLRLRYTGDRDPDWEPKFFGPYARLLARIPFYPTLGNHDGNATESRGDLAAYLDNFFFPGGKAARYYSFSYGDGLAEFFGLDTTDNTDKGSPAPAWLADSAQFRWMRKAIPDSKATWKVPYFHHPLFTAGPEHGPALPALQHFLDVFASSGVKVIFSGHEHNFQVSEASEATRGIRQIVSGSGGELRSGNVLHQMRRAHIAGWAAAHQFLVVEIDGSTMRVTPVGAGPIQVLRPDRTRMPMPVVIER
jgi:tartrate-resistant acid phosphatase type 5